MSYLLCIPKGLKTIKIRNRLNCKSEEVLTTGEKEFLGRSK